MDFRSIFVIGDRIPTYYLLSFTLITFSLVKHILRVGKDTTMENLA